MKVRYDDLNNMSSKENSAASVDVEQKALDDSQLQNTTIKHFAWQDVTVTVKDRTSKDQKTILDRVSGVVKAGEIAALMGPSGSGKTTLLNVLARREAAGTRVEGTCLVNGTHPSLASFRQITSYVEQEDALIGALTVRETLDFAARLANLKGLSKRDRMTRIDGLLDSMGLRAQESALIGTPIRKGVSGGQKRRVSVASALVTGPKILFLDEPTSGLDSTASFEVVSFIKNIAKKNNLIVVASIHQPSTNTFRLFDKLALLSAGKSYYFGAVDGVVQHFASLDQPMPQQMNPAEFILEITNTDFASDRTAASESLVPLHNGWLKSPQNAHLATELAQITSNPGNSSTLPGKVIDANFATSVLVLTHRSFKKSYRDVIAYGVRIAMYLGLAIMMGTVWLRLDDNQSSIQPFINALFFSSAFLSFMAVAYIPAFLEDRLTFVKERSNGLYGSAAFLLSNFIIGLPYLFLISCLFSIVAYWLVGFQPTAKAFFTCIMWLFLDLLAAESLVVLLSSIFPLFVVALALTAFANGLWMSVGGFLVPYTILNVFWKYVFSYIDYQRYVFQGLMINEFKDRTYSCGQGCACMYQSHLKSSCRIAGTAVLAEYDYGTGDVGKWVGILIAITAVYRLLAWVALALKK